MKVRTIRATEFSTPCTAVLAASVYLGLCLVSAQARDYPNKPIRLIVPFPPGGVDTVARIVAQELTNSMGQTVVVDNRAGASGTIGTALAVNARADGYTVLFANISLSINVSLFPKLPYDTLKDLTPVSLIGRQANLLVLHPSVNAKTVKELVALAKAQPGKLSYGSGGANTMLAMELFKLATGTDILNVPYNGIGPAMVALMGGQIQMTMSPMASSLQHVHSGKLRALGVSDMKRLTVVPDIPTMHEAGVSNYEFHNWYGLLLPAGAPRNTVNALHQFTARALETPYVKKQFAAQGIEGRPNTPEDYAVYLRSEIARFAGVIKATGMKPE